MRAPTPDPTSARSLAIAFACGLALLPGLTVVAPESSRVPFEKRDRAAAPELAWDVAALERWPEGFDAFFRDHIGLRYPLVRLRHAIKLGVFGESPSDALLVGRDGWLFLADDHALDAFRAEDPFDAGALDAWRTLLLDLDASLGARGARLLVVIAPAKATIYPEALPRGVVPASPRTRTDQLVAHLAGTDLAVLDLRADLARGARRRPVYHRLDTHWNGDGAAIAYRAIVARLGFAPLPESALERTIVEGPGDLSVMLHTGAPRTEPRIEVAPGSPRAQARAVDPSAVRPTLVYEVADTALPRAVVHRDSFATDLVPLLAEHFARSLWIWSRAIDPDVIAREAPDVVIFEIAERYLMAPVPGHAIAASQSEAGAAALAVHARQSSGVTIPR